MEVVNLWFLIIKLGKKLCCDERKDKESKCEHAWMWISMMLEKINNMGSYVYWNEWGY